MPHQSHGSYNGSCGTDATLHFILEGRSGRWRKINRRAPRCTKRMAYLLGILPSRAPTCHPGNVSFPEKILSKYNQNASGAAMSKLLTQCANGLASITEKLLSAQIVKLKSDFDTRRALPPALNDSPPAHVYCSQRTAVLKLFGDFVCTVNAKVKRERPKKALPVNFVSGSDAGYHRMRHTRVA